MCAIHLTHPEGSTHPLLTTKTTKNSMSIETFLGLHVSYITDHSTDSHKCVYKVPGVGTPDLSSPAACPDTLGILETGLHTYWQTAPWEKHSPSSQCQSLTINQQPTEALPRRALDRRTVVSEEKGLKCVCVYKHTGECCFSDAEIPSQLSILMLQSPIES